LTFYQVIKNVQIAYIVVAWACFCNLCFDPTEGCYWGKEQSSPVVDNQKEVLTSTNRKRVKPTFSMNHLKDH